MRTSARPAVECARDLERYREHNRNIFPALEQTPDFNRGEMRFAAEVAIAALAGHDVPSFAHQRAVETLTVMAKG